MKTSGLNRVFANKDTVLEKDVGAPLNILKKFSFLQSNQFRAVSLCCKYFSTS